MILTGTSKRPKHAARESESGRSRPLEVRCANIPLAWIPTTTGDLPGEHVESLLGLHFVDPTG